MAKTKAEMMAEKLRKERVGRTAFEAGAKAGVDVNTKNELNSAATPPEPDDLAAFVIPNRKQGRKGQKTPRMNLAIPEDVYEYIRRESRKEGMTYSEFICAVMRHRKSTNGKSE